jgi:hypothetical protein
MCSMRSMATAESTFCKWSKTRTHTWKAGCEILGKNSGPMFRPGKVGTIRKAPELGLVGEVHQPERSACDHAGPDDADKGIHPQPAERACEQKADGHEQGHGGIRDHVPKWIGAGDRKREIASQPISKAIMARMTALVKHAKSPSSTRDPSPGRRRIGPFKQSESRAQGAWRAVAFTTQPRCRFRTR